MFFAIFLLVFSKALLKYLFVFTKATERGARQKFRHCDCVLSKNEKETKSTAPLKTIFVKKRKRDKKHRTAESGFCQKKKKRQKAPRC